MQINATLREQVRQVEGRQKTPSAAIVASQSVKTTEQGGEQGYDAGKKINGRKRPIIVDTLACFCRSSSMAPTFWTEMVPN